MAKANAGSFNADADLNLHVNLDSTQFIEFTKTLKNIAKGNDLQNYWNDIEKAIENTISSLKTFEKNTDNEKSATRFLKQYNALKAMVDNKGIEFPDISSNLDSMVQKAKQVVPRINEAFSDQNFSQAFKVFELLESKGIELEQVFYKLSRFSSLNTQITELYDEISVLQNENSQLKNIIGDDSINDVQNYRQALQKLREEAKETFQAFLKSSNISESDIYGYGFESIDGYFERIEDGTLTAQEAISKFKLEYYALFKDKFETNGDALGVEQLQAFSDTLNTILARVEDTYTQIKDIISNGVITKSVETMSTNNGQSEALKMLLSDILKDEEAMKSLVTIIKNINKESGETSGVSLFDSEQIQQILNSFEYIENHLENIKSVISDVGDGEEFSPLLSMINNINTSIQQLSKSVSGIGLNMNIDVGSNTELENKIQEKAAIALQAYQRLFENIKMTNAGGNIITEQFLNFDINQYNTVMEKLTAYRKFIENMRSQSKQQFNGKDLIYGNTDKSYWNQVSSAMGQLTKAYNEMKSSSDTSPLEGLFGKTDLTGVIEQLNSIVIKLDEISTAITNIDFSKLSINSSNDGVSELTEKIKSLETELQTVKAEYASMKDAFQGGETSDNGESRLETANKLLDQQIQSLVQIKTLQTQISNASKNGEDTTKLENDLTLEKDKYTTLNNQLSAYDDIIPKLERQKALIEQASEIYSNKHKEESSALLKEQIENLNKIYELQAKIKVESSKKNSSTTALEDELKTRQENACQLKVESEQYNDIITQAERLAEITKGTNQARLKLQDVSNSKAAEQEAKALSDQAKLIEQLNSAYDKYSGRDASSQSDRYKELLSQLTQAKTIVDSLNGKTIDNMTDKELSDWQYAVKLFSSASAELGKMSSSEMGSSDSQRSKLLLRISEYMEKNTVAAKEYRAEFQALIDEINQKGANANVQELTTKFNKLKTSISDASKTGKSFMDVLKDKVWYGWAAQIASMYLSIYRLIGYLKTGISTIIDLDTALVDLKKTTTMNSSELDTFYYNSNEVAKQMGTTTEEIISQASAWSRLNKIGLLYSNV